MRDQTLSLDYRWYGKEITDLINIYILEDIIIIISYIIQSHQFGSFMNFIPIFNYLIVDYLQLFWNWWFIMRVTDWCSQVEKHLIEEAEVPSGIGNAQSS